MDRAERAGEPLGIVLLDWEKAFDKVSRSSLIHSLRRFGVPEQLVSLVASLYAHTNFTVGFRGGRSEEHAQLTGIRQGCPLSPYLFIIVMTAMWSDINHVLGYDTREYFIRQTEREDTILHELLYADDTLIFHHNTQQLTRTLALIIDESTKYGMRLNRAKCEFLPLNVGRSPQWPDGTCVKTVFRAKYLGTILDHENDHGHEISQRIKTAMTTWRRMELIWRLKSCPIKTRLLYWDMVVKAQLLYGVHLLGLTVAHKNASMRSNSKDYGRS